MFSPKFRISSLTISILFCLASVVAVADSHVRIVRLSYIEGGVQVSHGGQAYEKAMVNLPIAEGMSLKTASDGRAEIEFEDGSTLRVVPDSAVQFAQLSLRDSGSKASEIEVVKGTAYVNFAGTKGDEFAIKFGGETIPLSHATHLRVDLNDKSPSLAVFKGLVEVNGASGAVEVKKGQTIRVEASTSDPEKTQLKLAKNIQQEPWDSWDDQQNEYHQRYASRSYNSYSPYAYGTTDMAYYGNFFNYPGYGMMWQPYFAGAGWDPFMDGAWAFSPGWGYGWVSAYPWGWTPYHYGTWIFLPGNGWAWQPGGVWTTWYSQPVIANPPKGYVPPRAPITGTSTVAVNRGTVSTFSGSKLVLRNNSAGLGVPRGQFENMAKLSSKVQEHGMVAQRVNTEPMAMGSPREQQMGRSSESRSGGMSRSSEPMHTMSAPSSHGSGASAGPHH